ncbi:ABC transporter, ATP-binding protein [Segatella buccae ATCC 33574]|uniref:ABC transporter, ATP-binding protein n=2 Tax=Segatella buccae TaxID=28126 RepID=E6K9L5_9BACT|nr:ABC transporter, ATP-binding protein [Segatella buccae ATCC 33574]
MIAKHYGKEYSAEMLRQHCYISREGVSMLGISDAAEYIGFRSIGVRITFEQLAKEALLPCILHWNQNHFVVCYKIEKKRKEKYNIYISDPASQRLCYTKEEFLKCWLSTKSGNMDKGAALLLEPGVDFGKREEEVDAKKHSLSFFLKYFLPYKGQFVQLLFGMLVGSLLQLIFPFLTQAMVDWGIGEKNLSLITLVLIAQLTIFLAQLCVGYIRSWILLHVNSRIDISLISDFLIKLMNMPLHFFDTKRTGDIMQRIGDHGRIKSFLMGNSLSILFSSANFIIFASILAYYNMKILTIFLIGNTFYVSWILYFMKYRRELDIKRFNQASTEQNKIIQLIQGMQDIKLNNCEKQKRWEWERVQVNLFNISVRGLTIGQIQQAGTAFFTQSTHILISFIAARAVVEGQMTLGMMMSLTYIIGQISAPIGNFIGFAQALQDAKISLERLNEIHAQEDEEQDIAFKTSILPKDKSIRIDHLRFSYDGSERNYALDDVNLVIPEHKVTAIVGESGSGKTTLIKLMQGFYQPNSGNIKIGSLSLNTINPHLWRSKTGSVMQDSFIFSDTIANNIALNTDDIDTERLYHAAVMANADEFISELPLGYNTKIGMEGSGVSQGQRQRLLISRAIYKNPEYIFFDEATNSLDATNERAIMDNLHEFYRGKTVVIAAHRLSTVKDADQIVVMKQGHIVEIGTHEELVEKRGDYYTLVKNQLELGQ